MQTIKLRFTGKDNNADTAAAFTIGNVYDADPKRWAYGYEVHDDKDEAWYIASDDEDFEVVE